MAEVVGQGVIEITADVSKYEAALEGASKKAGKSAEKAGKEVQSAWGKAAKSVQQNQLVAEMETISALGIQVGGSISRVASVITSLIRPVAVATQVLGPMGLAIGAGTLAAGAGVLAIKAYGASAVALGHESAEAGERLRKLGMLTLDQARHVDRMTAAMEGAKVAQDRLTLAKAQAYPNVVTLTEASSGLQVVMADLAVGIASSSKSMGEWVGSVQAAIPVVGGFLETMQELAGPGGGNVGINWPLNLALKELARIGRDEFVPQIEEMRKSIKAFEQEMMGGQGRVHFDTGEDLTDVLKEDHAAREKARKERLAAEKAIAREIAGIERALREQSASDEFETARTSRDRHRAHIESKYEVERALQERTNALRDEAEQEDIDRDIREAARWMERRERMVADAIAVGEAVRTAVSPYTDTISLLFESIDEKATATHSRIQDSKAANRKLMKDFEAADDATTRAQIRNEFAVHDAQIQASRAVLDQQRKLAHRAWIADQAGKITQATMAGSLAVLQGYAQLGPIGGSIAAAGTLALTATQIAVIAGQKPPKYHTGGRFQRPDFTRAADEMDARVLAGEGAVSRRGMDTIGDEGLDEINDGRMPASITLHHTTILDGRVVERSVRKIQTGRRTTERR